MPAARFCALRGMGDPAAGRELRRAPGASAGSGAGARFLRANNGAAIFAGVMAVGRDVPIAPPG